MVETAEFGRWQQRMEDDLAQMRRDVEVLQASVEQRSNRTWALGVAVLTGIVLPIVGALIAAVLRYGTL